MSVLKQESCGEGLADIVKSPWHPKILDEIFLIEPFNTQSHHSWFQLLIHTHLKKAAIAPQKAVL